MIKPGGLMGEIKSGIPSHWAISIFSSNNPLDNLKILTKSVTVSGLLKKGVRAPYPTIGLSRPTYTKK